MPDKKTLVDMLQGLLGRAVDKAVEATPSIAGDIRSKVLEEPWYGRPVTEPEGADHMVEFYGMAADQAVAADAIDHAEIADFREALQEQGILGPEPTDLGMNLDAGLDVEPGPAPGPDPEMDIDR